MPWNGGVTRNLKLDSMDLVTHHRLTNAKLWLSRKSKTGYANVRWRELTGAFYAKSTTKVLAELQEARGEGGVLCTKPGFEAAAFSWCARFVPFVLPARADARVAVGR